MNLRLNNLIGYYQFERQFEFFILKIQIINQL